MYTCGFDAHACTTWERRVAVQSVVLSFNCKPANKNQTYFAVANADLMHMTTDAVRDGGRRRFNGLSSLLLVGTFSHNDAVCRHTISLAYQYKNYIRLSENILSRDISTPIWLWQNTGNGE